MSKMPSASYEPLTPLSFLERTAKVMPNEIAVIEKDKSWTWADFFNRVNRLSNGLKGLGISNGDHVAIISRNFSPMLEAHYGIPMTGAAIVAINYRLSADEVSTIVNLSEAKVLLVDMGVADRIDKEKLPNVEHYILINNGVISYQEAPKANIEGMDYETLLEHASDEYKRLHLDDENTPIAIDYTSGTTGMPKGCIYSHRSVYLHVLANVIEHKVDAYSVNLWTLPMFHCNGWCWTWTTTATGATNVCMPTPDAKEISTLIQQHNVTHMAGAPIVFHRLSRYMNENSISSFPNKLIIDVAAAPPPKGMLLDMEKRGGVIHHAYGLTETYGPFTICEWQPAWDSLSEVERINLKMRQGVPDITAGYVRVVNENDEDVPADGETVGEIIMRGNDVIQGYYKSPEETAKAFKNGWFYSGDGGVMHPGGYIEVKDRFKDVIITGGENVISVEVENILYEHPAVYEAVCYGKPDEEWGELVKALVHLKPGHEVTERELIVFCKSRLSNYKCPKEIDFGEIPRTSAGKVQKYKLRQQS
ncbi:AMP-binding protein [Marinomonas colpomeniae]|nr:AMP-binding protein [Marinomonas colpomeniae]